LSPAQREDWVVVTGAGGAGCGALTWRNWVVDGLAGFTTFIAGSACQFSYTAALCSTGAVYAWVCCGVLPAAKIAQPLSVAAKVVAVTITFMGVLPVLALGFCRCRFMVIVLLFSKAKPGGTMFPIAGFAGLRNSFVL
jgi:hypothetical protein